MNELATIRAMLNMTQAQLGEHLGLSLRAVQDNEAAEPRKVIVLAAKWLYAQKAGGGQDPATRIADALEDLAETATIMLREGVKVTK